MTSYQTTNCPFCNEPMKSHPTHSFKSCLNHIPLVFAIIDNYYNHVCLCKDGYEIEITKSKINFYKHKQILPRDSGSHFFKDGYYYLLTGSILFSIDNKYNITPDNFDSYVDKFKSLSLFI